MQNLVTVNLRVFIVAGSLQRYSSSGSSKITWAVTGSDLVCGHQQVKAPSSGTPNIQSHTQYIIFATALFKETIKATARNKSIEQSKSTQRATNKIVEMFSKVMLEMNQWPVKILTAQSKNAAAVLRPFKTDKPVHLGIIKG
uniref:Uncharacterized protein n=1 Tax=Glossina pallidipes TaxID=7398 RepID=A0A1A9ZVZ4_GLOPL